MSKLKIECDRKVKYLKPLAKTVYKVLGQKEKLKAELVFVSAEEIRTLNRETRSVDKVTDVLSYPALDGILGVVINKDDFLCETERGRVFIGSIAVCEEKIKEQAKEYGHTEDKEMTYLILHGLLHLFGYDHMEEEDKKLMREKEKIVMNALGLESN